MNAPCRPLRFEFVNPPIPNRDYDWCVTYGDDEYALRGWGSDRAAALRDLANAIEEKELET
jgi:hypothetical protein